jgi:hypothetical protein
MPGPTRTRVTPASVVLTKPVPARTGSAAAVAAAQRIAMQATAARIANPRSGTRPAQPKPTAVAKAGPVKQVVTATPGKAPVVQTHTSVAPAASVKPATIAFDEQSARREAAFHSARAADILRRYPSMAWAARAADIHTKAAAASEATADALGKLNAP